MSSGECTRAMLLCVDPAVLAPDDACRYNLERDGSLDRKTLHAGEPVVEGEKWGMNIWLRERPKASAV